MKLAGLEDELHYLRKRNERDEAEQISRSWKSNDAQVLRTRRLTVQDIAQRFGWSVGQVKRMVGKISD